MVATDVYKRQYLYQHLVGYTGSYQILGNVTGSISSTAVYLTGVFTLSLIHI